MTAPIIQARYDELDQIALRFGRSAEVQRTLIRTVQQQADVLTGGSWQGRGVTAFARELDGTVMPAMARLGEALLEAQRGTLQIAAIMHEAEEEASQPFRTGSYAGASGDAAPVPETKEGWWSRWNEWVHGGLDVVGFVPGIGEIADGVNAIIYLGEGRYLEAGVTALAMIPLIGDVFAKGGKWGVKGARELMEEGAERGLREFAEEASEVTGGRGVRVVSEAEMVRVIDQADRIRIGRVEPSNLPSAPFGTAKFGYDIQEHVADTVRRNFPNVEFRPTTGRGVEGPDMIVADPSRSDFDWIEIKPNTESGINTFVRREWGKSDVWTGRGRLAVYDADGSVSLVDYQLLSPQ